LTGHICVASFDSNCPQCNGQVLSPQEFLRRGRLAPAREAHLELVLTGAVCLLVGVVLGYLGAYWRYALKPYFEERSWR
jgi:hypothetical protein